MCGVNLSGKLQSCIQLLRVMWSDIFYTILYLNHSITAVLNLSSGLPHPSLSTPFTDPNPLTLLHREKRRDRIRKRDGFLPSCLPQGPFCILYVSVSYIPCNHCLPVCLLCFSLSLFSHFLFRMRNETVTGKYLKKEKQKWIVMSYTVKQ